MTTTTSPTSNSRTGNGKPRAGASTVDAAAQASIGAAARELRLPTVRIEPARLAVLLTLVGDGLGCLL